MSTVLPYHDGSGADRDVHAACSLGRVKSHPSRFSACVLMPLEPVEPQVILVETGVTFQRRAIEDWFAR